MRKSDTNLVVFEYGNKNLNESWKWRQKSDQRRVFQLVRHRRIDRRKCKMRQVPIRHQFSSADSGWKRKASDKLTGIYSKLTSISGDSVFQQLMYTTGFRLPIEFRICLQMRPNFFRWLKSYDRPFIYKRSTGYNAFIWHNLTLTYALKVVINVLHLQSPFTGS
jgi:hypothetical protein